MTIRIVTDSTCDIPKETADEYGIVVVPAYVNLAGRSYLDGVELTRQEFYKQLPGFDPPPSTAAPAPGAFTEAYDQLAELGATEVLSIHVSSTLSGILNAARLGAEATDSLKVTVFDSRQLTMGLGLQVISAATWIAAGCSMAEIVAMLNEQIERTFVIGLLDTLEYLRRSGRVNWAQFGIGTLLKIKPILQVHSGDVELLERVRTSRRALSRFLNVVAGLGALERMALLHTNATDEELHFFRQETQFLVPGGETPLAVELTPALGVHLGPKGLGIACIVKDDK
jgi:DegV family protein with EDD domain